jgi:hypothetical protein
MKLLVSVLLGAFAAPMVLANVPSEGAALPPDVVLHIETGPSVFTREGPEVTVFADGRAVIDRVDDGPKHIELTIPKAAVEHLLDDALRAGALRDFDFGDAEITDQATTTIELTRGDDHRKHSIYALVFSGAGYSSGDHSLTDEQIEARTRLGRFVLAASDPDTYAKWDTIEHPTGSDDVVFHTDTERNGWGGEYPNAVRYTVYGDGRVVFDDGTERQWSERRLQRFLRDARDVGLLGDTDYGEATVTDQGTTTITVHAGGVDRTRHIYALELSEGDRGLPREQREARRELRRFLHELQT